MDDVWDFIRVLPAMLEADIATLGPIEGEAPPAQLAVLGAHEAFVSRAAYVEPFVLADTTAGPILVRRGARVCAFTRLVGPCVVGADALVLGGKVTGCSIGEHARVQGELSTSIMIGHANKSHDGFVGHSVIGRWANLGAGTVTSNLKNSYGEVSLWTPAGVQRTGMQFLGTFVGDHVKTGIGTRLTTGCVIGAGANVFGSTMPPKFVPPFAWGDSPPFGAFGLDKFLEVAERAMKRRSVVLTDAARRVLTAAWARRTEFVP
jgi:UDP-N-acetylglucosamine diphosphorylase/glucosamine-1-phosphate N-acetyltransferase